MKGDFSRDAFDPRRNVYRVLMQQGRVQLDADWNEAAAVAMHRLETIVRDTFGPFGGPVDRCGFEIRPDAGDGDLIIGEGRYYVDGVLVENARDRTFAEHHHARLEDGRYLVYLDVWEEFVAPQQDPQARDPALGGLDTTARTRVAWRVRAHSVDTLPDGAHVESWWTTFYAKVLAARPARMAATVSLRREVDDKAFGSFEARYRGLENRLYRVEIHAGGSAGNGATFKWSRDNGSVAFAIRSIADRIVTVDDVGRDARAELAAGDAVEIVDDDDAGAPAPRDIMIVAHADPVARTVTLTSAPAYAVRAGTHPILRRWDQRSGAIAIPASTDASADWIALDEGISVRFTPSDAVFRAGDAWTIPARTAEGGTILWEDGADGEPLARESLGPLHHFAPLAGLAIASGAVTSKPQDYRRRFRPLTIDLAERDTATIASPLLQLGIENAHVDALAGAGIRSLEHVAAAHPSTIESILAGFRGINPLDIIERAKNLVMKPTPVVPSREWWHDR